MLNNSNTKRLAIAVAVLLVVIYLRFHTQVATTVKIIQLSLNELEPSVLLQKHPIIIDERIVNPLSLLQTVFKYMYMFKRVKEVEDGDPTVFRQNKARYMIFSSKTDDCSVQLLNPRFASAVRESGEEPPYVDIRLHANMCMVCPYKWWYRLSKPAHISSIALEDAISLSLGRLFSL